MRLPEAISPTPCWAICLHISMSSSLIWTASTRKSVFISWKSVELILSLPAIHCLNRTVIRSSAHERLTAVGRLARIRLAKAWNSVCISWAEVIFANVRAKQTYSPAAAATPIAGAPLTFKRTMASMSSSSLSILRKTSRAGSWVWSRMTKLSSSSHKETTSGKENVCSSFSNPISLKFSMLSIFFFILASVLLRPFLSTVREHLIPVCTKFPD